MGKRDAKGKRESLLLHLKWYPRLPQDIQQVVHHRLDQRNAFFTADRFRFALGVAGDQRAVCAGCGFGFAKDMNPVVDLFFELVFVDLEGAEEVADAFDGPITLRVESFSPAVCNFASFDSA